MKNHEKQVVIVLPENSKNNFVELDELSSKSPYLSKPILMTVDDVAIYLQLKAETVREMARNKKI